VFVVAADAYDRFMGRYSIPLAPGFCDFAGIATEGRVLDVGCGPGALTTELVRRLGPAAVTAVDPSEPFVAAARDRHPGVDVRLASAEELPFADREFDAALAQLVVHFMTDPVAGLRELGRVTRPSGVVAACVWDHGPGGSGPLSPFWESVDAVDPGAPDESRLAGVREGHLGELFREAGIADVEETAVSVGVEHEDFDAWWEPFTLGVGPAGAYLAQLAPEQQARVRELCRAAFPDGRFVATVRAWAARGRPDEQPDSSGTI
jgi:SAM-dependent methyltransferase